MQYGRVWERFVDLKQRYDPDNILLPGRHLLTNEEGELKDENDLACSDLYCGSAGAEFVIGGALGQVIRLNVVALSSGPCRATLGFASVDGASVGRSVAVTLAPGQAALLDLPMSIFTLVFGQRVEIRPVGRAVRGLRGARAPSRCGIRS